MIIDEYDFREVEIEGAVKNPGKYLVNEGEGILALVNRAGGYSKSAYPFGGILENAQTKRINRNAVDELYKTFLDELFSVSQASQSRQDSSNLIFLLDELKNLPINVPRSLSLGSNIFSNLFNLFTKPSNLSYSPFVSLKLDGPNRGSTI